MFICFLPDPETPPEVYRYWTSLQKWADGALGPGCVIEEPWPLSFKPPWLYPMMLPPAVSCNPQALFMFHPVIRGEELLAVILDSPVGYPAHFAARKYGNEPENAQAQHWWDRRWLPWYFLYRAGNAAVEEQI